MYRRREKKNTEEVLQINNTVCTVVGKQDRETWENLTANRVNKDQI